MTTVHHWIVQNTRRAFTLLSWIGTGQLGRAAYGLLPYYLRFVPPRIRAMVPPGLRRAVERRMLKESDRGRARVRVQQHQPARAGGEAESQARRQHGHDLGIAVGDAQTPMTWHSSSEFELDGLRFICDYTSHLDRTVSERAVIIAKTRGLIDKLNRYLTPLNPKTMLEIGAARGGSACLYTSLFNLSKYVGLELRLEEAELLALLKERYGPDRVKIYYRTSQDDKGRIAQICEDEFGGLCDVVIDDGSHQYELSAQTAEVMLPHLRPGGLYIIEDWSWAHWPGAEWQDKKRGYSVGKPALSNLVFELLMLCASRPDIIGHGVVESGFAVFRRGDAKLDWRTFKIKDSYLTQGRRFRML